MWTESSSVNSANLVNISATISEIKFFLGGYFFGMPCMCSFSTLVLLVGFLTCKNHCPYNLYCVGVDVKPCSINQVQDGLRLVGLVRASVRKVQHTKP